MALPLNYKVREGETMRTIFGAVAGALAVGAVLVAYSLGEHHTFNADYAMAPAGYQQGPNPANPYLVQAGQAGYVSPYGPYGTPNGFVSPYANSVVAPTAYPAQRTYVSQPAARSTGVRRTYASNRESASHRTWQKSALLIGGSAAGGAGIGALIGGKKGAGIGALVGGGSAALFDYAKRH